MKLNGALEGSIAGATTLGLLTETLQNLNGNSSHLNLFENNNLKRRLKKTASKKGLKATKQYIRLAEDLLASSAYMGLAALSKKKNGLLRGGVLGAAAGLGDVFLKNEHHKNEKKSYSNGMALKKKEEESITSKILKVVLYAIGGMIAGRVIQNSTSKKSRKKKK